MPSLTVLMNGYHVGQFTKSETGAHQFKYQQQWLDTPDARPISLSMPLRVETYIGDEVFNFFDNLLPDNPQIREKILARHKAKSIQPFDLLATIGHDSIGALQLLPQDSPTIDVRQITKKPLNNAEITKILKGYQSNIPLGMLEENDDFRISIAGAQEKTALLQLDQQWYLPTGATPTTHILKLPIGTITTHSHTIDLSDSVENELVCMWLTQAYGLPVAQCSILQGTGIHALSVERFDRKLSSDQQWIMRMPQEDFCQILNVAGGKKYQSDGGPSIADIMKTLLGSELAELDRTNFMKSQVLFWLLAASDGHAKNFSVFIKPQGGFRMTPLYDIMSVYPVLGGQGLNRRDIKMAMKLNSPSNSKGTYSWDRIFPRHFLATAKAVGFSEAAMLDILNEFKQKTPQAIKEVKSRLPNDFPQHISNSILDGVLKRAERL